MERGHSRARSDLIGYNGASNNPHWPQPSLFGKQHRLVDTVSEHTQEDGINRRSGFVEKAEEITGWTRHTQDPSPASLRAPPSFPPSLTRPSPITTGYDKSIAYDASRRRSLGASAYESHLYRPEYDRRAMPPPSPPTTIPSAAPSSATADGPPGATPFAGIRDFANPSPRRHGAGMSISSMLDNAQPDKSPSSSGGLAAGLPSALRPPSPARARAASMREPYQREYREMSPGRTFGAPRSALAAFDASKPRALRDDPLDSSVSNGSNGFRAYIGLQTDARQHENGYRLPGRPSSQPTGNIPALLPSASNLSDDTASGRLGLFRSYDRQDSTARHDEQTRDIFRESGEYRLVHDVAPMPGLPAMISQERSSRFRPAYPPSGEEQLRDSIEDKAFAFSRGSGRMMSPDSQYADAYRNGYYDRPLTYEEHQRLESSRDYARKDSDGFTRRSVFNISPEMMRRGRDSPLPQAVQGARSRHVGPSGDHPGIKSEFGRMFSGLGSGATPVAGQSANVNTTPSRVHSPTVGDLRAGYDLDDSLSASALGRLGRKQSRKGQEEDEFYDSRLTPGLSARSGKRAKTTHPMHHHHHHHHHSHHHHHTDGAEQPGSYGMIRFPSNPTSQPGTSAHRHHHHHHHAHPPPHHHHAGQRPTPVRKQTVSIISDSAIKSVADLPRHNLGSMPYTSTFSQAAFEDGVSTAPFTSKAALMPRFDGRENCTFTIRVPRWVVSRTTEEVANGDIGRLEEICRRRHVWGSDIYTDDSDVLAAAVHAGWVRGDFGHAQDALQAIDDEELEQPVNGDGSRLIYDSRPARPAQIPDGYDLHITILVLPPLQAYLSSHRHHIQSREWDHSSPHDGMSFMVHKVEFVLEGQSDRGSSRNGKSRKSRMALEEEKRRTAAAALLMLPGAKDAGLVIVPVGA